MSDMGALPTGVGDWAAYYAQVTAGGEIAFRGMEDYRPTGAVVSGVTANLSAVMEKARADGRNPGVVTILVDVLVVDVTTVVLQAGGMLIAARRIEHDGRNLTVDVTGATHVKLAVAVQSTDQPLTVTVSAADGAHALTLPTQSGIGRQFAFENGVGAVTDLDALHGGYDWGMPLRRSLLMILQYGAASFDAHPGVAGDMFSYVIRATQAVGPAVDIHDQAVALLASLNAATSSVVFVPTLDRDVYENEAKAFAAAALAHEEARRVFVAATNNATKLADAAKLMQARYADTVAYNATLLGQAKDNLLAAQIGATEAYYAADAAKHDVGNAAIHFQTEASIWARTKKIEAAFKIITTIVEVVGAVALMAEGDLAAEQAAFKSAEELKVGTTEANLVAANVAEFQQFGTNASELQEKLHMIGEIADTMAKLSMMISSIDEMAQDGANTGAAALPEISLPANGLQSIDAQWDLVQIDIDAMMAPAVDAGIPGASEYQVSLAKLVIYAKAAMASQSAVIAVAQDVFRLTLQSRMDSDQKTRIDGYIAALSSDASAADALGELFFTRELSMRLSAFLATRAYANAFAYWALKPSRTRPSMISPVSDLMADIAAIARDYDDALQHFPSPPQKLAHVYLDVAAGEVGPNAGVVDALKAGRKAFVTVSLGDAIFDGYNRIRLNAVRVWLNGVTGTNKTPVNVTIASSAYFEDRLGGRTFRFSTAPLRRGFRYVGGARDASGIQLDALVEDRERFRFFQPTPFTQWTISLPTKFDLTGLTGVTLEFEGSAIAGS